VQRTDELRTLIQQRYQEELAYIQQVVGAWVSAQAFIDATVQGLRLSDLATTNPSEIYNARRADFQELLDAFFAAPDPGAAQAIVAGAQGVLEAGQLLWDRPSAAFQALFEDVATTLESVSAALGTKIGEFTGGVPFEDFMREKQQAVVDQLGLLHADLQEVIDGLAPGATTTEEALALFDQFAQIAAEQQAQMVTADQVAIGYLAQIAANTAALTGGQQPVAEVDAFGNPVVPPELGTGSAQYGMEYVPRTGRYLLHQGESVATRERAGGVTLRFGDVVVNGGGDPRAVAEAVIEEVERRLRGASRLRVAVQDAARGR